MAGIGLGLVLLLPLIMRKLLLEVDGWSDSAATPTGLVTALSFIVIAGVIMGVGTWFAYTPGANLEWWVVTAIILIVFALYAWRVLRDKAPDYHLAAVLTIFIVMLGCFSLALVRALDDNSHRIDSGTVVDQSYTQETYISQICANGVCTGGYDIPEDWALKLCNRDVHPGSCTYGTVHFSRDVFGQYPIGSYYHP
jgi:hypothetical protein